MGKSLDHTVATHTWNVIFMKYSNSFSLHSCNEILLSIKAQLCTCRCSECKAFQLRRSYLLMLSKSRKNRCVRACVCHLYLASPTSLATYFASLSALIWSMMVCGEQKEINTTSLPIKLHTRPKVCFADSLLLGADDKVQFGSPIASLCHKLALYRLHVPLSENQCLQFVVGCELVKS